ncbi:MAG: hypothetical protein ACI8PT_001871 [Gammaproteobacteria bacterium]|jgi:hypothetical protein
MNVIARIAADALLIFHVTLVAFVVLGLALIITGGTRNWRWVRNPWLRLCHMTVITVVVAQSWAGIVCPLTTWEMALRERAGDTVYAGGFISHWFNAILYYQAPEWVFTSLYSAFGTLVLGSLLWVRPRHFNAKARRPDLTRT